MTRRVKTKTIKHHPATIDHEVVRDGEGEISMVILNRWRDNPLAPTTFADTVGGIQRLPSGLIRVTFVQEVPLVGGGTEFHATEHKLWTERCWLDAGDAFKWIMHEFGRGAFVQPDGERGVKMQ